MNIPTSGIANTRPEDMSENDFTEWLECIPEEKRPEWVEKRKNVIWQSIPAQGAKVLDLRHMAFTLEIQAVEINHAGKEFIYKEIYSRSEIVTLENPKGKPNKKAFVLFALPIL